MSSFVVSNELMNRVVHGILISGADKFMELWVSKSLPDQVRYEAASQIGARLYEMNVAAFVERYGGHVEPPVFEFEIIDEPPISCIVAIDCLLYQCSEGMLDESEPYRAMDDILCKLAVDVIRELPDYQKQRWG